MMTRLSTARSESESSPGRGLLSPVRASPARRRPCHGHGLRVRLYAWFDPPSHSAHSARPRTRSQSAGAREIPRLQVTSSRSGPGPGPGPVTVTSTQATPGRDTLTEDSDAGGSENEPGVPGDS